MIAHELGHVAGGHSIRMQRRRQGRRPGSCIPSLVLGALAIAAGAGDAGMGIMAAGQQAAMGNFLAFTPHPGKLAPTRPAPTISPSAGISGKGSIDFFKKLQNQEYRLAIYAKDSYDRTHPLRSERIQALERVLPEATRPGTGRPIRRSRRASSGSRPS